MVKFPDVIYEDETILVLNKPAGLAVQGGKGVTVSLDDLLRSRDPRPLLVHRLDRGTSGLILCAKTAEEAARCARVFAGGAAEKRYLAVCAGEPPLRGSIAAGLEIRGRRKNALTAYRRLAAASLAAEGAGRPVRCALLELTIATGRMHQIRRHLAASHWPVLGDDKYGDFALNKSLKKAAGLRRLLLHARSLRFPLSNGGNLELEAPLPDSFRGFLAAAGLGDCSTLLELKH
ncbi:MAG: RluA family pseudouridine synthase [Treponema sp.]|jgi:23S rRNA pseudouridine955/2504/2580 synthase|nr:RluA family pseudouridine synthase [Treponema sp.]